MRYIALNKKPISPFTRRASFFPAQAMVSLCTTPQGRLSSELIPTVPILPPKDELVLMDSTGQCLVTLHRKKPSIHQRWEGFLGENHGQGPIFNILKSSIIGQFEAVAVAVAVVHGHEADKEYRVKGSFLERCCAIYDAQANCEFKELVAEVKRKVDPDRNIMLGKDVFLLCLKPLADAAFVMALLLVLDLIGGANIDDDSHVHDVVEVDVSS